MRTKDSGQKTKDSRDERTKDRGQKTKDVGLWTLDFGRCEKAAARWRRRFFLATLPLCRREGCATLSALSGIDALGGAIQREPSGRDP